MVQKIPGQCKSVNIRVVVRPAHARDTSPSIIRNSAKSIRAFHAKAISANRFGHRGLEKKNHKTSTGGCNAYARMTCERFPNGVSFYFHVLSRPLGDAEKYLERP